MTAATSMFGEKSVRSADVEQRKTRINPGFVRAHRARRQPENAVGRVPAARDLLGYASLVAACVCISAAVLISKQLLVAAPVLPLVFLQLASSAVLVWTAALVSGRLPLPGAVLRLGLPGMLQPGLAYVMSFAALAVTPVSVEGLLFSFETVLVILFAWPLLGERPDLKTLVGAGAATAGAILVSGSSPAQAHVPFLAVALIFGGVTAAALDTVVSRGLMVDADPLALTAASHVTGLFVVGGALLLWPSSDWRAICDPRSMPALVVSGLLLHGVAPVLFNAGLARVSAGAAATLLPLVSLMIAGGGLFFFDDRMSGWQIVGGVLVCGAAASVAFGQARASAPLP